MFNKKPASNRLIVEVVDNEQITDSGIIIADSYETTTQRTKIIAVGKRRTWTQTEDMDYQVGHYAYIPKHSGIEIGFNELVIKEEDILYTSDK